MLPHDLGRPVRHGVLGDMVQAALLAGVVAVLHPGAQLHSLAGALGLIELGLALLGLGSGGGLLLLAGPPGQLGRLGERELLAERVDGSLLHGLAPLLDDLLLGLLGLP